MRVIAFAMIFFVVGCNSVSISQDRDNFLQTVDPRWSVWLDTIVYVNLRGVTMRDFRHVKRLGFGNTPLQLRGGGPQCEPIVIDAYGISIRELMWRIHKKYGFIINLCSLNGDIALCVRSLEVARLDAKAGRF